MNIEEYFPHSRPTYYIDYALGKKAPPYTTCARNTGVWNVGVDGVKLVGGGVPNLQYDEYGKVNGLKCGGGYTDFSTTDMGSVNEFTNEIQSTTFNGGFHTFEFLGNGVEDGIGFVDVKITGTGATDKWFDLTTQSFEETPIGGSFYTTSVFAKLLYTNRNRVETCRFVGSVWIDALEVYAFNQLNVHDTIGKSLSQCMSVTGSVEKYDATRNNKQIAVSVPLPDTGYYEYIFRIGKLSSTRTRCIPVPNPGTSAITVAPDVAVFGSNGKFSGDGVIVMEFELLTELTAMEAKFSGASVVDQSFYIRREKDKVYFRVKQPSATEHTIITHQLQTPDKPETIRLVVQIKEGEIRASINGRSVNALTLSLSQYTSIESISFGGKHDNTDCAAVVLKRLYRYAETVGDSVLQSLSRIDI